MFVETPVALELKDAEDIRDAAVNYKRKVFVDLFDRFTDPYEYLRDIHNKKLYGKLRSFCIQRKTPPIWGDLGPENIVTNLMIHDIDFIVWLLGSPKELATRFSQSGAGQCAVAGLLQYEGTHVQLTGSSMMPLSFPFMTAYEAIFDEAVIRFYEEFYKDSNERSLQLFKQTGKEDIELVGGNCYEKVIKHVIECITEDKAPLNGITEAVESLKLSLAVKSQIIAS